MELAPNHTVTPLPASIKPRAVAGDTVAQVPGLANDWGTRSLLADFAPNAKGGETLPLPGDVVSWYGGRGDGISDFDWSHPQFRRIDGSFEDALAGAANWARKPAGDDMQPTAQAILRGDDGKHYLAAIGSPSDLKAFWPYYASGTKFYVWQTQHLPEVGKPVEAGIPQLEAIVDGDRYVDLRS